MIFDTKIYAILLVSILAYAAAFEPLIIADSAIPVAYQLNARFKRQGLGFTTQRPTVNLIANQNTVAEGPCINQCSPVSNWRPVCGTDNITYSSIERLRCAQQSCGRQVQLLHQGTCQTNQRPQSG
ncbi:uncharacterized protein LOC135838753 [Planococcus citri]|uniref:uncharacterized protein LOC135838753 n=1 Tax=Planococcus citri TaxID=170843 RepID=UPI0031F8E7EE